MKLNDKQAKVFSKLHRIMFSQGYEIRLIGGAVRDIMQGKDPKDLDFATTCLPIDASKLLNRHLIHVIPTGIKHGTITAIVEGETVEITTLRVDVETDGRHAEVAFTDSWEEDARRRDLTVNAMSMDFSGTVYDYFGGKQDLASGTLRFVGDTTQRVQEDYLRILRYFRFASHAEKLVWDYDILDIFKNEAEGLSKISGERIWSELIKILLGKNRYNVLYAMDSVGILQAIGIPRKLEFSTYWEFLRLTDSPRELSPLLYLATLIKDLNELEALRDKWRFDNNSERILYFIIDNRNRDAMIQDDDVPLIINRMNGFDPALFYHYAMYRHQWDIADKLMAHKDIPAPKFPVSGNDLIAAGVEKGRRVGDLLTSLKTDWIKSQYKLTKEELLSDINRI